MRTVSKVARTDSTVLVSGESGTGKELIVRLLHCESPRAKKPFVPINCGAIPRELIESELFGHEKGAFTHAYKSRTGRFELANGGTVFLDEIGELDISLQVKILRVIQEKEIERVGGHRTYKVDVRIIAATNRNLEQEVEQGRFREDLFYRLNVVPISLPPLRERKEDIITLANSFLEKFCAKLQRSPLLLTPEVQNILLNYSWPGNVRELENNMERLSILCEEETIQAADLPEKILKETGLTPPPVKKTSAEFSWPQLLDMQNLNMNLKTFLDQIEGNLLHEALTQAKGVKNRAAEILGIKRTTLIEKLKKRKFS